MTRPVRRSDIPHIGQLFGRARDVTLHQCRCGRDACIIGTHLERSTRDMAPGIRATNTDPRVHAWPTENDDDSTDTPRGDGTRSLHDEYTGLLAEGRDWANRYLDFVEAYRPDRFITLHATVDDIWCRSCLRVGRCEPRHRKDPDKPQPKHATELCRWCRDFRDLWKMDPPEILLRAKHNEGKKITQQMVDAAILEERKAIRRKRKKAS